MGHFENLWVSKMPKIWRQNFLTKIFLTFGGLAASRHLEAAKGSPLEKSPRGKVFYSLADRAENWYQG